MKTINKKLQVPLNLLELLFKNNISSLNNNKILFLYFLCFKNPNELNKKITFRRKEVMDFCYINNEGKRKMNTLSFDKIVKALNIQKEKYGVYSYTYKTRNWRFKTASNKEIKGYIHRDLKPELWDKIKIIKNNTTHKLILFLLLRGCIFIKYETLMNSLKLSIKNKQQYKFIINKSIEYLKEINFIDDYKIEDDRIINIKMNGKWPRLKKRTFKQEKIENINKKADSNKQLKVENKLKKPAPINIGFNTEEPEPSQIKFNDDDDDLWT